MSLNKLNIQNCFILEYHGGCSNQPGAYVAPFKAAVNSHIAENAVLEAFTSSSTSEQEHIVNPSHIDPSTLSLLKSDAQEETNGVWWSNVAFSFCLVLILSKNQWIFKDE